jgi:hypothetical protein
MLANRGQATHYPGWQESLAQLANLVDPEIPD